MKTATEAQGTQSRDRHIGLWAYGLISLYICAAPAYGAFEAVELGSRPSGMGSAYVAVADDVSAIFWNSAGLARIDRHELTMSYMELYSLVSYSSLGYAQRIKNAPLGFGLVSSSDADGIYREMSLILSAAHSVWRGLSMGSNIKYLSADVNTGDVRIGGGRGVSLDLGCQWRVMNDLLSFGVAFQNLVGCVWYSREATGDILGRKYSQMPGFSYKVGSSVSLKHLLGWLSNAVFVVELSDGDFHTGAECDFWNVLAIRAGFRTGNALTRSVTAGFGMKLSGIRLDYAYIGSEVGAQTSQFSISVNW